MNFSEYMQLLFVLVLAIGLTWLMTPKAAADQETVLVSNPDRFAVDVVKMLEAIKLVENTPREVIGSAGERSEYQITQDVWEEHSTLPFNWANSSKPRCVQETRRVANAHINKAIKLLIRDGQTVTVYSVAAIWKAGWRRFKHMELRQADVEYSVRCVNIYQEGSK